MSALMFTSDRGAARSHAIPAFCDGANDSQCRRRGSSYHSSAACCKLDLVPLTSLLKELATGSCSTTVRDCSCDQRIAVRERRQICTYGLSTKGRSGTGRQCLQNFGWSRRLVPTFHAL